MNIVESCLYPSPDGRRKDDAVAMVWRKEWDSKKTIHTLTLEQLRVHVNRVSHALRCSGYSEGDVIAIYMPAGMISVVAYLAIIQCGCAVVSIAESFAPPEIETRVRLSNAKAIITQDFIFRKDKNLPLYEKVVEALAPPAIVYVDESNPSSEPMNQEWKLRNGDILWSDFLRAADSVPNRDVFSPLIQNSNSTINILFSSGTTGTPKGICWNHCTAMKCASDAFWHQDFHGNSTPSSHSAPHSDDSKKVRHVACWPSSIGWMMGPWLIFSSLINGSIMAIFEGSPLGPAFCQFVQDAKVTMLGVIPSIVRAWKNENCTKHCDWSSIRCYSSTGEASNPEDSLWLMSTCNYKSPIFEYCGGTEVGGAFLSSTFFLPFALSCFNTPTMGSDIFILDDHGRVKKASFGDESCNGEIALWPIQLGASYKLLNAHHYQVYFKGMPLWKNKVLRRHGDAFEVCVSLGGRSFFRALGRVDDTMNLGGIKVSSIEIERVCNRSHKRVLECAAIGLSVKKGEPEQLVIVVVLTDGPPLDLTKLHKCLAQSIQTHLNPLFKLYKLVVVPSLPRTSSNKIMRRVLRNQFANSDVYKNLSKL